MIILAITLIIWAILRKYSRGNPPRRSRGSSAGRSGKRRSALVRIVLVSIFLALCISSSDSEGNTVVASEFGGILYFYWFIEFVVWVARHIEAWRYSRYSETTYTEPLTQVELKRLERERIENERQQWRSVHTNDYVDEELFRIDGMDGRDFEFWCANLLKLLGYANVKVTPLSGDQGADVLCEKAGRAFAIQCKCYASDLGNTPIQEITAAKMYYDCDVGVVMTNRYFTQGALDLADKTSTILWDRDAIIDMLYQVSQIE